MNSRFPIIILIELHLDSKIKVIGSKKIGKREFQSPVFRFPKKIHFLNNTFTGPYFIMIFFNCRSDCKFWLRDSIFDNTLACRIPKFVQMKRMCPVFYTNQSGDTSRKHAYLLKSADSGILTSSNFWQPANEIWSFQKWLSDF